LIFATAFGDFDFLDPNQRSRKMEATTKPVQPQPDPFAVIDTDRQPGGSANATAGDATMAIDERSPNPILPHSTKGAQFDETSNGTKTQPIRSEAPSKDESITSVPNPAARPMQIRRFIFGLLLSTLGLGGMLLVAVSAFRGGRFAGDLSLPAIGLSMIAGLMLLGGGFGIMATASPTFDDQEFERLVQLGEQGLPVSQPYPEDEDRTLQVEDGEPQNVASDRSANATKMQDTAAS
jgi:hypothetical protein